MEEIAPPHIPEHEGTTQAQWEGTAVVSALLLLFFFLNEAEEHVITETKGKLKSMANLSGA